MVDTPQHELGCLPKLRDDPHSVFCPNCGAYNGKHEAFVDGFPKQHPVIIGCNDCSEPFSISIKETKVFGPDNCKACSDEDCCNGDASDCDHESGECPISHGFAYWVDEYKVITDKI